MLVFKTVQNVQKHLSKINNSEQTIGFIPTMGALHEGHLSLVNMAKQQCDYIVSSIFVNPTQFNQAEDLEKYPRTIEKDLELLQGVGNDVVFLPTTKEIYPPNQDLSVSVELGQLAKVMEGKHRSGHFDGVLMVVNRLLDIVKPHYLYMGQKDLQQHTIISALLEQTNNATKLVVCPIKREADGLAMSSRNTRLSTSARAKAPIIFQTLSYIKNNQQGIAVEKLLVQASAMLVNAGFDLDYLEIADSQTLLPITSIQDTKKAVACVAATIDDIRLIDNLLLN